MQLIRVKKSSLDLETRRPLVILKVACFSAAGVDGECQEKDHS